jgi:hypothetical protein
MLERLPAGTEADQWVNDMFKVNPLIPNPPGGSELQAEARREVVTRAVCTELVQLHTSNLRHIMIGESTADLPPGGVLPPEMKQQPGSESLKHYENKPTLIWVEAPANLLFQTHVAKVRPDDDLYTPEWEKDMSFIANGLHEVVSSDAIMFVRVSPMNTALKWREALLKHRHWIIEQDMLVVQSAGGISLVGKTPGQHN